MVLLMEDKSFVFAYDFTVLGGTLSQMGAKKNY